MGCCCGIPCQCNSGGGKYKTTKIVTVTGVTVPTGICLTSAGGPLTNISVINPNQTFTLPFIIINTGGGCKWDLTTTSAADCTEVSPCVAGSTFNGFLMEVSSVGPVGSLVWNFALKTKAGAIIFTTVPTIYDGTDRSFSLDCNGTATSIGNNGGATGHGLYGGTLTVQDS